MAIDRDAESLEAFRERWPGVPNALGDVGDVIERSSRRFDVIYLDFCAHLSDDQLRTMAKVIVKGMRSRLGTFAVTYLRGREKSIFPTVSQKREHRTLAGIELLEDQQYENDDGRHDYLLSRLRARLMPSRLELGTRSVVKYQSRTEVSPGSPMGISVFQVHRLSSNIPIGIHQRFQRARGVEGLKNQYRLQTGKPLDMASAVDWSSMWTEEDLKMIAMLIMDEDGLTSKQAAQALNVEPGTVSAWRAHYSRGSYDWRKLIENRRST